MAKVKLDYCNLQTIKFRFAVINVFVVSSYLRVHLRVHTSVDFIIFIFVVVLTGGSCHITWHGIRRVSSEYWITARMAWFRSSIQKWRMDDEVEQSKTLQAVSNLLNSATQIEYTIKVPTT